MYNKEFETEFQKLFTKMVEISFEYVNNSEEIEQVYVYGAMETGSYMFDVFYKKENSYFERHEVNKFLNEKVDASDERQLELINVGCDLLIETAKLFREFNREIPTLMQMMYYPKTGKFKNEISYDLKYTNHPLWTSDDIFNQWFEKEKKAN